MMPVVYYVYIYDCFAACKYIWLSILAGEVGKRGMGECSPSMLAFHIPKNPAEATFLEISWI
jgi:hypothetical protein